MLNMCVSAPKQHVRDCCCEQISYRRHMPDTRHQIGTNHQTPEPRTRNQAPSTRNLDARPQAPGTSPGAPPIASSSVSRLASLDPARRRMISHHTVARLFRFPSTWQIARVPTRTTTTQTNIFPDCHIAGLPPWETRGTCAKIKNKKRFCF